MKAGRVFILESPSPLDLLENRGERLALEQVCKLVGYDAVTFLLRDGREFRQTCRYVSGIQGNKNDKTPLFLHISLHGNEDGIAVGEDLITWPDLAMEVQKMYDNLRYYHGPVILILSACGANRQELTDELTKRLKGATEPYVPPEFIFVFAEDTVDWRDAVVTWTIFYRQIAKADFEDKTTVQTLLSRLHESGFGNLRYFRWDKNKYLSFLPKKPSTARP